MLTISELGLALRKEKKIRYSTTDTATQAVREVVGGRSRLSIGERRRPVGCSAMALAVSEDGPAGLHGPGTVHRPSSGK